MDAPRQLHHGRRVANLESHREAQLALRLLADADDVMCSRHVHGHRLFAIDVLARGDYGFQMMRMEVGRGGDEDEVHFLRGGDFLIGIGPLEELCGVDGARSPSLAASCRSACGPFPVGRQKDRRWRSPARRHSRTKLVASSVARPPQPRIPKRTWEFASVPRTCLWLEDHKARCRGCAAPRNSLRPSLLVLLIGHFHSSLLFRD